MSRLLCSLLWGLAITQTAFASGFDAVPSCYGGKVVAPSAETKSAFFLLIDQTTLFDSALKQSISENVQQFLEPGNSFAVVRFSAFTQGHYTETLVSGRMDHLLDEADRHDISKAALKKLDACLVRQKKQVYTMVGAAMRAAFNDSSTGIARTDVLASLKDISALVKNSSAKRKVVLIASDMLENSSVSSFYYRNAVRRIEPDKELQIAEKSGLMGDFGGAEIYVIGAGLLAEHAKKTSKGIYRSPQIIQALRSFWNTWFQHSNAELKEFGSPSLLTLIKK